jgi:hypothetical protein
VANAILAYPNHVDADPAFAAVAFDGGQWRAELPLTNIRDRLLVRRARSVNVALSSTQFWIDLGVSRDVRVAAIPFLTASRAARIRIRAFLTQDAGGAAQADSEWRDVCPVVYPFGSLYYGHPAFWDGRMTQEEAALFSMPVVVAFPQTIIARWWLFEIDDTTSALGYVEVPRAFLAPGWQPTLNMVWGASVGFEPRTTVVESYGGAQFFDVQRGRRVARFGFDYLPETEALAVALDMQRRLGVDGQLFFVYDPDDTVNMHRRSFPARSRVLSPLQAAVFGRSSVTFEIEEQIA